MTNRRMNIIWQNESPIPCCNHFQSASYWLFIILICHCVILNSFFSLCEIQGKYSSQRHSAVQIPILHCVLNWSGKCYPLLQRASVNALKKIPFVNN